MNDIIDVRTNAQRLAININVEKIMVKQINKGNATGMAGEFFVMEQLYRRGIEPALTVGNAKAIDILVSTEHGLKEISVKAVRGGGKWGIGTEDYSKRNDLIFVCLHYKKFDNLKSSPIVYIIPGHDAEKLKKPWFSQFGIYFSNQENRALLEKYIDAWHFIDGYE